MRLTHYASRDNATFMRERHPYLDRPHASANGLVPTGHYAIGRIADPDIQGIH